VSRRLGLAGGALMLLMSALALPPAAVAAGAEYQMQTKATYLVQPAKRAVAVSVKVTFTNTTPNPAGKFSVFESVPMALQDGAASVAAKDAKGALKVALARDKKNRVNVASVSLRAPLRFNKSATFTLTYSLPDGGVPSLRVRPSAVVFPAWSFGTKGDVRIDLPSAYEVVADGDRLAASHSGDTTVLQSGAIPDPPSWLALVTATRPSAYVTLSRSVPLSGGSADLQVRTWQDDPEWGKKTLDLAADALPLLETAIGVPYSHVGPLIVTESAAVAPAGIGEPAGESEQGIGVIFDEPAFTALHELVHVWVRSGLAADRWIREGLASYYAEKVAGELRVKLPYDPASQLTRLKADAFQLSGWAADEPPERDQFGYAASWALIDEIARLAGPEAVSTALQRAAAGVDAYQAVVGGTVPDRPRGAIVALDSRRLLDQLERVSGKPLTELFAARVLTAGDVSLLPKRAEARTAFGQLVVAAGDWGTPAPIRQRLSDWDFDGAMPLIAEATGWLKERDALVSRVEATGLTAPQRLQDRYVESGGGPASKAELEAEGAIASSYAAALERANRQRSLIERIGLAAGPEPSARLATANALFAAGDLRGAADATDGAQRALDGAAAAGWLRIASLIVALVAVAVLLVVLASRGRREEAGPAGED
jgi:hypothetical protein